MIDPNSGFVAGAIGGAAGGALGWGINKLMNIGSTKAGNTAKGEGGDETATLTLDEQKQMWDEMSSVSPDDGPGLSYGGGKRKYGPNGESKTPKVGKLKPVVKPAAAPPATAHAGTTATVLAGAQAVYHLLNALSSATSLTVSPAVFFLPLMLLSGDTPNRGGAMVFSRGGKKNMCPDQYGYPPNPKNIDWTKGNQELADIYSGNDPNKGPGKPHNWLIKWFRDHRPKKK